MLCVFVIDVWGWGIDGYEFGFCVLGAGLRERRADVGFVGKCNV